VGWGPGGGDLFEQFVEVDGGCGVHFEDGGEGEGLGVLGEGFRGHFLEDVGGVVALAAGARGEAAGGFFEGQAAVNFDDVGGGEERGDLVALVAAAGTEVGLEDEGWAVGREGPEEVHCGGADEAGGGEVAGGGVERGEEGFLDVVFGEEGKAEAGGEGAGEGGFAGGGRAGDEDDAIHAGSRTMVGTESQKRGMEGAKDVDKVGTWCMVFR